MNLHTWLSYLCISMEIYVYTYIQVCTSKHVHKTNPWILVASPATQYPHTCLLYEYSVQTCLIYSSWSKTSPQQRSSLLLKIAELVEQRGDQFAEAESRDQGKPVWLAKKVDVPRAVHNFRFFATAILHSIET